MFIQLTRYDGKPIPVNMDQVCLIEPLSDTESRIRKGKSILWFSESYSVIVWETIEGITEMLIQSMS
jgi:uncharacterized protein YlzI (FlbEa/FlbD family)